MSVMSEMSLIEKCKEFGEEVFGIEDSHMRTKLYMNKLFSHGELEIINEYVALRSYYLNDEDEFGFEYDIGLQKNYNLRPAGNGECEEDYQDDDITYCDINVWLNGVWMCEVPVDEDKWFDMYIDVIETDDEEAVYDKYLNWELLYSKLEQKYVQVKGQLGIGV